MLEISLKQVEKNYNVTRILDDVTFDIVQGDRIGIIGRNGTGKTTLFKILMGGEPYDGGNIAFRKGMKLGYLDQVPEYPESVNVRSVIREALEELSKIQDEMNALEREMSLVSAESLEPLMDHYSSLITKFDALGGYDRYVEEQKIIEGFDFDDVFLSKPFTTLSGGEKTRVMLARLILSNPDVLLLDEPSNHLDTNALEWLESYLVKYKGAVVAISHDRYFLDSVVNKIIELEDRVSQVYHGNYTYYLAEKERRLLAWVKDYKNQQKQLKAMNEAIDRFRAWSSCGQDKAMIAKIKNMEKRIERIDKIDKPILERKKMQVNFNAKERSGKEVLKLTGIKRAFGEQSVLNGVDCLIWYKDAFALLGNNGCGKSTLLKIVTEAVEADAGEVKLGSRVHLAYLDQNLTLGDESLSVLELYRSYYPCKEGIARGVLARSLFIGEDIYKEVSNLSGGEKMRLKLCILMQQDVNFLILDEPTNHLDIESREMLEATLSHFEGTILFVSHDRYFVRKLATRVGVIENGKMRVYEGDYNFYQEKRLSERLAKTTPEKKNAINVRKKQTEKRKVSSEGVESLYKQLEEKIEALEIEMADHPTDYALLESLHVERSQLEEEMLALLDEAL